MLNWRTVSSEFVSALFYSLFSWYQSFETSVWPKIPLLLLIFFLFFFSSSDILFWFLFFNILQKRKTKVLLLLLHLILSLSQENLVSHLRCPLLLHPFLSLLLGSLEHFSSQIVEVSYLWVWRITTTCCGNLNSCQFYEPMAWSDLSMEQIHVHQSSWMMLMATLQRRLIQAFLLGINKIKTFFAGSMPHYQKGCWHMLWDWLLLEVPSKGGLHLYPSPKSSNWKPNSNIKKGPQSIIEYVQKIKTISDSLAAVSCPVDEEDLIIHTLNGLPPEYGAFKTAIRTRSSPISIEELHVLLLREEMNLDGSQQGIPDFSTTAPLTSKDTVKLGNFNNNRGRGNCARGQGRFNSNRGRGNSYSQRSNSHSQNSRSCCHICNRTGHTALDYFHRMDCCFQEKHPPSQLAAMATSYHPAAEQTMVCRFRGYKPHHPMISTIP